MKSSQQIATTTINNELTVDKKLYRFGIYLMVVNLSHEKVERLPADELPFNLPVIGKDSFQDSKEVLKRINIFTRKNVLQLSHSQGSFINDIFSENESFVNIFYAINRIDAIYYHEMECDEEYYTKNIKKEGKKLYLNKGAEIIGNQIKFAKPVQKSLQHIIIFSLIKPDPDQIALHEMVIYISGVNCLHDKGKIDCQHRECSEACIKITGSGISEKYELIQGQLAVMVKNGKTYSFKDEDYRLYPDCFYTNEGIDNDDRRRYGDIKHHLLYRINRLIQMKPTRETLSIKFGGSSVFEIHWLILGMTYHAGLIDNCGKSGIEFPQIILGSELESQLHHAEKLEQFQMEFYQLLNNELSLENKQEIANHLAEQLSSTVYAMECCPIDKLSEFILDFIINFRNELVERQASFSLQELNVLSQKIDLLRISLASIKNAEFKKQLNKVCYDIFISALLKSADIFPAPALMITAIFVAQKEIWQYDFEKLRSMYLNYLSTCHSNYSDILIKYLFSLDITFNEAQLRFQLPNNLALSIENPTACVVDLCVSLIFNRDIHPYFEEDCRQALSVIANAGIKFDPVLTAAIQQAVKSENSEGLCDVIKCLMALYPPDKILPFHLTVADAYFKQIHQLRKQANSYQEQGNLFAFTDLYWKNFSNHPDLVPADMALMLVNMLESYNSSAINLLKEDQKLYRSKIFSESTPTCRSDLERAFNQEKCYIMFLLLKHLPKNRQVAIQNLCYLYAGNDFAEVKNVEGIERLKKKDETYTFTRKTSSTSNPFELFLLIRQLQKALITDDTDTVQYLLRDDRILTSIDENYILYKLMICKGDLPFIKYLLEGISEKYRPNPIGENFLPQKIAVYFDHLAIIEYFIKIGVDMNQIQSESSLIHIAAQTKQTEIYKRLLQYGGIELSKHLLKDMVEVNDLDAIKYFAGKKEKLNAYDDVALIQAAKLGRLEILEFLLEYYEKEGLFIVNTSPKNIDGLSNMDEENNIESFPVNKALVEACRNGHTFIVQRLLKIENIDPTIYRNNPISTAARRGDFEIVKCLMKHPKVDPTANNHYDAFIDCCLDDRIDILELLIKHPKVNPIKDVYYTPPTSRSDTNPKRRKVKLIEFAYSHNKFSAMAILFRCPTVFAGMSINQIRTNPYYKVVNDKLFPYYRRFYLFRSGLNKHPNSLPQDVIDCIGIKFFQTLNLTRSNYEKAKEAAQRLSQQTTTQDLSFIDKIMQYNPFK